MDTVLWGGEPVGDIELDEGIESVTVGARRLLGVKASLSPAKGSIFSPRPICDPVSRLPFTSSTFPIKKRPISRPRLVNPKSSSRRLKLPPSAYRTPPRRVLASVAGQHQQGHRRAISLSGVFRDAFAGLSLSSRRVSAPGIFDTPEQKEQRRASLFKTNFQNVLIDFGGVKTDATDLLKTPGGAVQHEDDDYVMIDRDLTSRGDSKDDDGASEFGERFGPGKGRKAFSVGEGGEPKGKRMLRKLRGVSY